MLVAPKFMLHGLSLVRVVLASSIQARRKTNRYGAGAEDERLAVVDDHRGFDGPLRRRRPGVPGFATRRRAMPLL